MLTSIHNLAKFRKGMTLVELLIAMSIMVMMAAITAAFYPSISSDNQISNTANKIQSSLVGARQKARRDRNTTGIRFYCDSTNPRIAKQYILIQKPSDLTSFSLTYQVGMNTFPGGAIKQIPLLLPTEIGFFDALTGTIPIPVWGGTSEDLVSQGDVLYLFPGGQTVPIVGKGSATHQVKLNTNFYNPSNLNNLSQGFKIIRQQCRVIPGEEVVDIPEGYEVWLDSNSGYPQSYFSASSYFPSSLFPNTTWVDVTFDTNGVPANAGLSQDIQIWLHKTGSTDPNEDAIITVRRTTGSVNVFPVGPVDTAIAANHDPFKFTRDLSNEGL
jgi:prepilin-type N-terminal cleavage/methylation domain-containing protein